MKETIFSNDDIERHRESIYTIYSIDPDRKTFQVLENDDLKAVQFTHALSKLRRCCQIHLSSSLKRISMYSRAKKNYHCVVQDLSWPNGHLSWNNNCESIPVYSQAHPELRPKSFPARKSYPSRTTSFGKPSSFDGKPWYWR